MSNESHLPDDLAADEPARWAAGVLGIPDNWTAEQRRAEVLRKLDEAELVPPPEWDEAVRVLSGHTSRGTWFERHIQELPLLDIANLADKFFRLTPGERSNWLTRIRQQGPVSEPWESLIEKLQSAIDVDVSSNDDPSPRVRTWGRLLCKLFISLPSARARLRRKWLARMSTRPRAWLKAARIIKLRHPELVALDEKCFSDCCRFLKHVRKAEGLTGWNGIPFPTPDDLWVTAAPLHDDSDKSPFLQPATFLVSEHGGYIPEGNASPPADELQSPTTVNSYAGIELTNNQSPAHTGHKKRRKIRWRSGLSDVALALSIPLLVVLLMNLPPRRREARESQARPSSGTVRERFHGIESQTEPLRPGPPVGTQSDVSEEAADAAGGDRSFQQMLNIVPQNVPPEGSPDAPFPNEAADKKSDGVLSQPVGRDRQFEESPRVE